MLVDLLRALLPQYPFFGVDAGIMPLDTRSRFADMTEVNELDALTQSIGEHAVQALGEDRLRELSVVLYTHDMTCMVTVCLEENTDAEQQEALESLFDVQGLFFEDVSMSFDFGAVDEASVAVSEMQRQFSYV